MGHKENKLNVYLSNLVVKKKSNDNSHSKRPVFYDNGKSLIICHGNSCHLYNCSTGSHVKELFQCSSNIISHHLHPLDDSLIIAVTENGEVTIFNCKIDEIEHKTNLVINQDLLNSKKISKFDVENENETVFDWTTQDVNTMPHRKFVYAETKAFQGNNSNIFIWASWYIKDEISAHVSVFSLQTGKHLAPFSLRKSRLKIMYGNFVLSKSQDLDVFVGLSDYCVHVAHFENKNSYYYSVRKHYTGLNNTLTCVAMHPTENSIATGDSIGRIIIWKNIFDKYPLKEIFHWHSMAVGDILFSKFGNYFFSGGVENVLVKWSVVTRKKQFLPRLSSAICYLAESSESSQLSVVMSDSRISVLDFNFEGISTIQNFSKWCTMEGKESSIFTVDPRSNSVVIKGKIGHIQFLSLREEGKLMYVFDVTNRNFINSHSSCTVTNTEVTHATFSTNGEWLITAESRKESACKESRLKFWKFNSEKGSYVLNTNVEFPHEGDEIYCLEISSDGMVVTTGPDKRFRLWSVGEHQVGNTLKEIWSVYSDRKYRHLPCYAVDFSKDSSLVAVTFGSILTIWETNTCLLKCSLSSPNCKEPLKVCKFGNNELTHLVVTGTDIGVSCWNTITLALVWAVPYRLTALVSDPFSIYMVTFSQDSTLVVFNPASPNPNLILKKVCDSPVVAARCILTGTGKLCLYFLTKNQELYCLSGEEDIQEAMSNEENEDTMVTPYAAQVAQIQNRQEATNAKLVSVVKNNQKFVSDLLNSPAHTLSNPSSLCAQVLKGLLLFSVGKDPPRKRLSKMEEDQVLAIVPTDTEKTELEINENNLASIVEKIFV